MGRPEKWPPTPTVRDGRERLRFRGREWQLGPAGSDEAKQNYARLIAELAAGGACSSARTAAGPTVAEAAAAWLSAEAPRYGASHEMHAYRRALSVLVRLYGSTPARDFGPARLEAVMLAMATDEGWCRNHVNRQAARLRSVWRWAERHGWAPAGAWASLRTQPGLRAGDARVRHTPRRRACSEADVEAAAASAPTAVAAMLRLQLITGMRSGEVRTMRGGDLDRSGDVWLYRPRQHKTLHLGTNRIVALGPRAQALLTPFLRPEPDAYLFSPDGGLRPYGPSSYPQAVRRAAERAGLAGPQPGQCRHAFRDRVTSGMSLDAARASLGHSAVTMTARYGEEVDLAAAKEAARRMG